MSDFTILSLETHLSGSKNKDYQSNTIAYYRSLIGFLQSHDLLRKKLLEDGQELPVDFRLMKSDMTDEGFELIRCSLDRWLASVTSGKRVPTDISILDKALKKLRSS